MVSDKFDNSTSYQSPKPVGGFLWACGLISWIALVVGCLSIFWNSQATLTGAQWAERSANLAAICVGLIYGISLLLTIIFLFQIAGRKTTFARGMHYFVSIVPCVVIVWGMLEASFFTGPDNVQARSVSGRLVCLDKLAHIRLLGGSLWQSSTSNQAVQIISNTPDVLTAEQVAELGEFASQVRLAATGNTNAVLIRMHTQPLFAAIVLDTGNWAKLPSSTTKVDSITYDQWRATAVTALNAELSSSQMPPAFFRSGFVDYFSRSTDELMDAYFQARSSTELFPSLQKCLADANYSKCSSTCELIGAAFVTYLLEEREIKNLSTLLSVQDSIGFQSALAKLLNEDFSETDKRFEDWLRLEANRMQWDQSKIFRFSQKFALDPNNLDRSVLNRLKKFELGPGVPEDAWQQFLDGCWAEHKNRLSSPVDLAIDVVTKPTGNQYPSNVEILERTRILKRGGELLYAHADANGERAVALMEKFSSQSERDARSMARNTRPIATDKERENATAIVERAIADWLLQSDFFVETERRLNTNTDWIVQQVSNGGSNSEWKIVFQAKGEPRLTETLSIDPNLGYSVTKIQSSKINERELIERELRRFGKSFVINQETQTYGDAQRPNQKRIRTTCQSMDETRIGSFCEEMGYMQMKANVPENAIEPAISTPFAIVLMRSFSLIALGIALVFGIYKALR